jgi:ribonuclease D
VYGYIASAGRAQSAGGSDRRDTIAQRAADADADTGRGGLHAAPDADDEAAIAARKTHRRHQGADGEPTATDANHRHADAKERIAADDTADVPALSGWRREVFGNAALDLKTGKLAFTLKGKKIVLLKL